MKLPAVFKRDYMQTVIMIVAVILVVLVFWYGLSFVFRTEHPILAVASGSMEPVLYAGDLIVIEGVDSAADIQVGTKDSEQPGDIIVFHRYYGADSELIVHRAVERTLNSDGTYSFKTWGDNNGFPDGQLVREKDVVGRYLGIKVPWIGNIALFFEPFEVKVAFIALWVIILILLEFVPLMRKRFKRGDDDASLYK
jgi:signal peptidase I